MAVPAHLGLLNFADTASSGSAGSILPTVSAYFLSPSHSGNSRSILNVFSTNVFVTVSVVSDL